MTSLPSQDDYAFLWVIAAKKSLQLGEVEYSTSIEFISASITAGRNEHAYIIYSMYRAGEASVHRTYC